MIVFRLAIALRSQTPKHIRGDWSHYSDTSEPVDGNGAQNMVTVQSGYRTSDLLITGPMSLLTALAGPTCYGKVKHQFELNVSNHV
jgi:hypothetical protein